MEVPFIVPRHGDLLSQALAGKPKELMPKRNKPTRKRELSVFDRHQLKIALDTLKMNDVMARVMGGPSKEEARVIVKRLTGKTPRENPRSKGPAKYRTFGRKKKTLEEMTLSQLEIAALKAFPSSPVQKEIDAEIVKRRARGEKAWRPNPRRTTGRTLRRKKIATSHRRRRYEMFRKSSIAGIEKPSATAQYAKQLADAEKWAYDNDVEFEFYYGADAGEETENEWDGRVVAEHPDGTRVDAFGYLGNDYSQAHVKAEAALALMQEMGGKLKKRNAPRRAGKVTVRKIGRGKFVKRTLRARAKRRTVRRKSNPAIGILGNPPSNGKFLGKVTYIEYTHGHDGEKYYHDFKPAVYAEVMNDGSVRLSHPTNKLWKLFPEPK